MGTQRTRLGLAVALLAAALAACGPPQLPGPGPTVAGGGRAQCRNATGKSDPWLVEWDATHKARMQAASGDGILLVRYSGCDLEVLYGCEQAGRYDIVPTTPGGSTEYITSEADIFAKLPVGALNLAAEYSQGDRWSFDYVIVGMQRTRPVRVSRAALSADCATATHYVSGMAIGAYRLVSEAQRSAGAGATVYVAGVGGGSKAAAGSLRRDGAYERCVDNADAAGLRDCQAIVQLFLEPLADGAAGDGAPGATAGAARAPEVAVGPPAATAPALDRADAAAQPGTNLVWLRCPIGAEWDGGRCVGEPRSMTWADAKDACPVGYDVPTRDEWIGLLGSCDRNVGQERKGACVPCRRSGSCVALFGEGDGRRYWSATTLAGAGGLAWYANLADGGIGTSDKERPKFSYYVRCVRRAAP